MGTNIIASLNEIESAIETLRGKAQALGSNVALLQTRLAFTYEYVNTLEEGAGKLTLADINEEGANLVALQVRQPARHPGAGLRRPERTVGVAAVQLARETAIGTKGAVLVSPARSCRAAVNQLISH